MGEKTDSDVVAQFPPHFRETYRKAISVVRGAPDADKTMIRRTPKEPYVTPQTSQLVRKLAPNTVVGRALKPDGQRMANFIQPVANKQVESLGVMSSTNQLPIDNSGILTVGDWQAFYELVKNDQAFLSHQEVSSFVKLVESIPTACGCVRGSLSEAAAGQYAQMLPILQARDESLFNNLKSAKNITAIAFRDKDSLLLQV